eukprot:CAMPEP_0202977998 /NCGR_PEP_ID=MMETSP1396-20130829/84584_1 /ASSEMBLY_ACC=CAM_ASM_000872 /TAXON_ID= /ORGANISM="Pseudokeronopsis sp., Strain Brazil" /LENGTH=108 /DNA_ID=CAMNT_0049716855 /DNA_START=1429 /DNA_END=1752 /DNA_ORIENTATION=-
MKDHASAINFRFKKTKECSDYCRSNANHIHRPFASKPIGGMISESNFELYKQTPVPKRTGIMFGGSCPSNASTISTATVVSKSDISQQEFELRKKMIGKTKVVQGGKG